jgi:tetratricopeptide (TPR) repeat protein
VLDERATVERAADTGLLVPVLRAPRRRAGRLRLLMDVSTSTVVWDRALDELRRICERSGAFREVRVGYLHADPAGRPRLGDALTSGGPLLGPAQLRDPTGQQLMLLFSDCAGPMWRSGRLHRLLHHWALVTPVAVVQPLPQRLWPRTHLPARSGALRRREGLSGRLEFRPDDGWTPPGVLPVPVLAPRPAPLAAWAGLVSGATGQSLTAAAGWVSAAHPPSIAVRETARPMSARERVQAFRRTASPAATQLMVHLSAAPLVLPVMQHVQRAMFPGSGPEFLAEVLLSGLLRRDPEVVGDAFGYAFLDGVHEELLEQLPIGDAQLILKHCSSYVERRFGRAAQNFPAMAAASLAGGVEPPARAPAAGGDVRLRPFARVSARVLRRYRLGQPPTGRAAVPEGDLESRIRDSMARYRRQRTARDLDTAVELLCVLAEGSGAAGPTATARVRLAEALLERWHARRLPEDLRLAHQVAEAAGTGTGAALARARSWQALAEEVRAAGPGTEAMPDDVRRRFGPRGNPDHPRPVAGLSGQLLMQAVDSIDALGDLDQPALEPDEQVVAAATLRMRLLAELVRLAVETGGPAQVHPATGRRAVQAAALVIRLNGSFRARLLRGEVTLRLAQQLANHPDQAGRRAREAAADLRAGLEEGAAELAPSERGEVLLLLAEALRPATAGRPHPAALTDQAGQALEHALREVVHSGDDALRVRCYRQLAEHALEAHGLDGRPHWLERAVGAWRAARELLPDDDPGRPGLLTDLATALARLAAHHPAPHLDDAVRTLHEALAWTSESSAELPARRFALGGLLLDRFRWRGALSDLHEAEWVLGAAARGAPDDTAAGAAWFRRGEAAALLAERTGSATRFQAVGAHYREAAERWEAAGEGAQAAAARLRRAAVLERIAGPDRALAEYRRAAGGLPESGPLSAEAREAIGRLGGGTE